jgi:hypothetical protein
MTVQHILATKTKLLYVGGGCSSGKEIVNFGVVGMAPVIAMLFVL